MEKVEEYKYIGAFIESAIEIIKQNTGIAIEKEGVSVRFKKGFYKKIVIHIQIVGDVIGDIYYEFSKGIAIMIFDKMVEKAFEYAKDKRKFRKYLNSALMELGNQISGRAATLLEKEGYITSLTPPNLYMGEVFDIESDDENAPIYQINLRTYYGGFSIILNLRRG